jgi:hypothetical protein
VVERLAQAPGMRAAGLGERLEPERDLVESILAGLTAHRRKDLGVLVQFARDRRLQIVHRALHRATGIGCPELVEMTLRDGSLLPCHGAEYRRRARLALRLGLRRTGFVIAAGQCLDGKRELQVRFGPAGRDFCHRLPPSRPDRAES